MTDFIIDEQLDDTFVDPFLSARKAADQIGGEVVLMPDGRLRVSHRDRVIEGTVLPAERFAAPTTARRTQEQAVVRRMVQQETRWLRTLITVDRARTRGISVPDEAPDGWYLHTTRSHRFGDHLHAIAALLEETGLYHVFLWRYVCHEDGLDTGLPLDEFVGWLPTLTHHGVHVYTTRTGTVLCLSRQPLGGLPNLEDALARTVLWLEGAAHAVRGVSFPYVR